MLYLIPVASSLALGFVLEGWVGIGGGKDNSTFLFSHLYCWNYWGLREFFSQLWFPPFPVLLSGLALIISQTQSAITSAKCFFYFVKFISLANYYCRIKYLFHLKCPSYYVINYRVNFFAIFAILFGLYKMRGKNCTLLITWGDLFHLYWYSFT